MAGGSAGASGSGAMGSMSSPVISGGPQPKPKRKTIKDILRKK